MFSPAEYKLPPVFLGQGFYLALYSVVYLLWLPVLSGFQQFSLLLFLLAVFMWQQTKRKATALIAIQLHNSQLLCQLNESPLVVEAYTTLHCSTWLLIVELNLSNQQFRVFVWRWLCGQGDYRQFYLYLKRNSKDVGI